MVYGVGVNDMPKGWRLESELNSRIYNCWHSALQRCYSDTYKKKYPSYKDCYVCDKWLRLSGFVEDISFIDNYEYWASYPRERIALDKDIKSNGANKCYCLEQCMFINNSDNVKQSNKTMRYDFTQTDEYKNKMSEATSGERNGRYGKGDKVCQYNKNMELIKIWDNAHQAGEELNINDNDIRQCCKFWEVDCNKEEWFKNNKRYPVKSCGGFVWKFYEESYES